MQYVDWRGASSVRLPNLKPSTMTTETKEIRVNLHDLDAVPGALLSVCSARLGEIGRHRPGGWDARAVSGCLMQTYCGRLPVC
jgi:hypothetical protein